MAARAGVSQATVSMVLSETTEDARGRVGTGTRERVLKVTLVSWPTREFGQWLRLRCVPDGEAPTATVRIYLVGKS